MSFSEKIKAIHYKIEQSKAQYSLDRLTATISALSPGNISKYELLTGKVVLSEKDVLGKSVGLKRFQHSPLGNKLKAKISPAEK